MKKTLFISVKEEYSEQILEGTKTIELRKSVPKVANSDRVIIYCTSPTMAIVGVATIKEVIVHTPEAMWRLHSKKLGIRKNAFSQYYAGVTKAVGIVLEEARRIENQIHLKKIKKIHPKFTPPQTYRYLPGSFLRISAIESVSNCLG